jgi:hypothetical protein
MPNLREHCKRTSEVFNVPKGAYKWVHQLIDSAQPFWGKDHRRIGHNVAFCELLAQMAWTSAFDSMYRKVFQQTGNHMLAYMKASESGSIEYARVKAIAFDHLHSDQQRSALSRWRRKKEYR